MAGFSRSYDDAAGWNHFVKLPYLDSPSIYYRVGDSQNWSEERVINNLYAGTNKSFSVLIYGDYGIENSENTTKSILTMLEKNRYQFVIHAGDLSYANNYPNYEDVWNKWFSLVDPVISRVPYQVSPGNHEVSCSSPSCLKSTEDFVDFKYKFEMPGNENGSNTNMFYSYNYQNVHFVSISTETDYPNSPKKENFGNKKDQLLWLENDLIQANLPENRKKRPFIVCYGHRPIYTGNAEKNNQPNKYAKEIQRSFEPLFQKYNVDFFFTGHVHNYQRNYPVYNNLVTSKDYNNYASTIHIISGAAGQHEG